jgi:mannitol/fructose-specific phosphotransferase system IIA component (Ntr-type)
LFLLISPNVRTHLRVLARLSFCLHTPEFKQAILDQASRETILNTLVQTEARLPQGS